MGDSVYFFFLGGHDLEMLTIRELLERYAAGRFHDKNLAWGAKTSDYREEIGDVLEKGMTPVFVELTVDIELDAGRIIVIDHHGKRAGSDKPTSLHQVFDLLNLPKERWTRQFDLVAANDRGYIPEMVKLGATQEEIIKIRAADRKAQGITKQEESQGETAVANAETLSEGMLTVVRLPHSRTAVVADRLQPELGGPGYKNLLVLCPEEVNFFGAGAIVHALDREFPGGWYGGALPERGFWGHGEPVPYILDLLMRAVKNENKRQSSLNPCG